MLTHEGIPLRRIQPTVRGYYLIERIDRMTFQVPIERIGTDEGTEEVLRIVRRKPGRVLSFPKRQLALDWEK